MHRAVIERLPVADTIPAFDDLATGPDGSIWVRRLVMPAGTLADWYLLNRGGGIRASLRLPVGDRIESATTEQAVVRSRDPQGSVVLRLLTLTGGRD